MNKINKRIYYSYFDYNEGLRDSYIDIDLKQDENGIDEPTDQEIKKYVLREWNERGYKNGDINSVSIQSIQ